MTDSPVIRYHAEGHAVRKAKNNNKIIIKKKPLPPPHPAK